jgi:uncharacterized membrane protein YdjX (TVP38/TMEM64 family)
LGNIAPIAFVTAVLPMLGSTVLLMFAVPIGNWLRENWEIGSVLFTLGTFFFCGLALLPTNVIGIVSGWAFGFAFGIALLITGIVGAALVSFAIHSQIVGEKLPHILDAHPKAKAIYNALIEENVWRTTLIIFLLRLSPAMPFALTNFLLASARVPLKSYLVGTFFGMLPRSSAAVFVGAGLSELNMDEPSTIWLFLSGATATIVSIIVISYFSKRELAKMSEKLV